MPWPNRSNRPTISFSPLTTSDGAAVALENLGWTYTNAGRERANGYFQESLALFRSIGCLRQSGRLLTTLAQVAREEAYFELARDQLQEALVLARTVDDLQGAAQALNGLSELASLAGAYEQTAHLLAESLALAATAGSKQDLAWVYCGLAENGWHRGDLQSARRHGESSYRLFQELGSARGQAISLHHLGLVELALGDVAAADHCLHRGLHLCHSVQSAFMAARCLAGLGGVAVCRGEATRAVQLLSTATACFAAHPHQLTPADEAFYRRLIDECCAQLDDSDFLAAWAAGQAMSVEEAIVCACR